MPTNPFLQQLRAMRPDYADASDIELANAYADSQGFDRKSAYSAFGIQVDDPGFVSSFQRGLGQSVQGVGQIAEDIGWEDNPIKRYGQGVIDRNPAGVNSLEDIADNPWLAFKEAAGNAASFLVPGGVLGVGGKLAGLGGRAMFAGQTALAGLPSYGGIREQQLSEGHDLLSDKLTAGAGAATVGAIENLFGLQKIPGMAKALGLPVAQNTERQFLRSLAESPIKTGAKAWGKAIGGESVEELMQNPVEQVSAYRDPTTPEAIDETLFGGAMGALGGLGLGGVGGFQAYRGHAAAKQNLAPFIDPNNPTDLLAASENRDVYNFAEQARPDATDWNELYEGRIPESIADYFQQPQAPSAELPWQQPTANIPKEEVTGAFDEVVGTVGERKITAWDAYKAQHPELFGKQAKQKQQNVQQKQQPVQNQAVTELTTAGIRPSDKRVELVTQAQQLEAAGLMTRDEVMGVVNKVGNPKNYPTVRADLAKIANQQAAPTEPATMEQQATPAVEPQPVQEQAQPVQAQPVQAQPVQAQPVQAQPVKPFAALDDGEKALVSAFMGLGKDGQPVPDGAVMSYRQLAKKLGGSHQAVKNKLDALGYTEAYKQAELLKQVDTAIFDDAMQSEETADDLSPVLSDEKAFGAGEDTRDANLGRGVISTPGGSQSDIGSGSGWQRLLAAKVPYASTRESNGAYVWSDDQLSKAVLSRTESHGVNDSEIRKMLGEIKRRMALRAERGGTAGDAQAAWEGSGVVGNVQWKNTADVENDAVPNGLGTRQREKVQKYLNKLESGEWDTNRFESELEQLAHEVQVQGRMYSRGNKTNVGAVDEGVRQLAEKERNAVLDEHGLQDALSPLLGDVRISVDEEIDGAVLIPRADGAYDIEISQTEADLSEVQRHTRHEVTHMLDGGAAQLHSSREEMEVVRTPVQILPKNRDSVVGELLTLARTNEFFKRLLSYPLRQSYIANTDNDALWFQSELFAQAGSLYFGNGRAMLELFAPKTAKFFKEAVEYAKQNPGEYRVVKSINTRSYGANQAELQQTDQNPESRDGRNVRGSSGVRSAERKEKVNQAPLWYSRAAQHVLSKGPGKAPAAVWMSNLNSWAKSGAIKPEEIQWSGVENWLKGQTGTVSREDVAQFFNEGGVQVEEKVLGKSKPLTPYRTRDGWGVDGNTFPTREEAELFASMHTVRDTNTHYSSYTEPGAKEGSYREILLKLPRDKSSQITADSPRLRIEGSVGHGWEIYLDGENIQGYRAGTSAQDVRDYAVAEANNILDKAPAKHKAPHYGEENENILATARINERTDAEGNRVLYIEEIQSDWAQDARKHGMQKPGTLAELERLQAEQRAVSEALRPMTNGDVNEYSDVFQARWKELNETWDNLDDKINELILEADKVQGAPFIGKTEQWAGLILKRLMRYAADNGFDKVAWSTGEQQFERWGSERVSWQKNYGTAPLENNPFEDDTVLDFSRSVTTNKYGHPIVPILVFMRGKWVESTAQSAQLGWGELNGPVQPIVDKFEAMRPVKARGVIVAATEQTGGNVDGQNIEEMARARGVLLQNEGQLVESKEDLRKILRETMRRENNEQQIDAMTDKLWDRMQTEPEGDFMPRREGMRGFYGDEQGRAPDGKPSWLANALKALPAEIRPKLESVDVDFGETKHTATVKVDGEVVSNKSGVHKAARFIHALGYEEALERVKRAFNEAVTSKQDEWRLGKVRAMYNRVRELKGATIEVSNTGNRPGFTVDKSLANRPMPLYSRKIEPSPTMSAIADKLAPAKTEAGDFWSKVKPKLLTIHQIVDQYGDKLASLGRYVKAIDTMEQFQQKLATGAHPIVLDWQKLTKKQRVQLHRVMLDATMWGIHPDKPMEEGVDADKYNDLKSRYSALPSESRQVYNSARSYLSDMWSQRTTVFDDLVKSAYARLITLDPGNAKKLEAKRDKLIAEHTKAVHSIKGPYFPLLRFGDYLAIGKSLDYTTLEAQIAEAEGATRSAMEKQLRMLKSDPKHYAVYASEHKSLAESKAAELSARGLQTKIQLAEDHPNALMPFSATGMEKLRALFSSQFDGKTSNKLDRLMTEVYISSLPEHTALQRQLKRIGVEGAEENQLRAFARAVEQDSFHLSRMKYNDEISGLLFDVAGEAKAAGVEYQHVANNLKRRIDLDYKYEQTPILSMLGRLSSFWHLGVSPAYLFTNSTQPWMIALPQIAGRHGFGSTLKAMSTAWNDAKNMIVQSKKDGAFADIKFDTLTSKDERDMLQTIRNLGQIDITINFDLGNTAESISPALLKLQKSLAWANHHIEVSNRITTALAAYRLARGRMGHEEAVQYAYKSVIDTQLDYSNANAAYFMKSQHLGGLNKLIMQFRKYQQGMFYLLARNGQLAFKGDKQALKSLGYLMAMQGAFAGAAGVPFLSMAMFLAGFGLDDDDPDGDAETQFRNFLADAMGADAAQVFYKGLPAMLGMDLSKRIGLGDIWDPTPFYDMKDFKKAKTGKEAVSGALFALAGPAVGTMSNFADAAVMAESGQLGKAAEKMLPKVAADVFRAARYGDEGLTTRTGAPVIGADQFTSGELLQRGLGFASTKETEHYAAQEAKMDTQARIKDRREKLIAGWARYKLVGDPEDLAAMDSAVKSWNDKHPEKGVRIDQSSLLKAVQQRRKNLQQTNSAGVRYSKSEGYLKGIDRFAGTS